MLYADFTKRLDSRTLKIHIEADSGILGIFGASGAGKSMTLKCIAGIETPDSGLIKLNDRVLYDSSKHINIKPRQRRVGYLFQEYALFPNMTLRGNIMAGLNKHVRSERRAKADELMEKYHIAHLSEKRPDRLSGGERQRAALARIFASEPELILLDEPFSSLDTLLKCELIPTMKETVTAYGKGCVMVSHDVAELGALCDRVTTIIDGANTPAVSTLAFVNEINERYSAIGAVPTTFYGEKNDR